MIIQDHNTEEYKQRYDSITTGKHNGAYYYSKEIIENFIPNIITDYNWQTIYHNKAPEHCIVFVHSNNNLALYNYLLQYDDVILVCSTKHSQEQLLLKGHKQVIYVPLSIDVEYLSKFKSETKRGTIACGNVWAFTAVTKTYFIQNKIPHYHDLERDELLTKMGNTKTVYAIGRCAMEAIYLGANVIQPDKEYPVEKYDTYYTQTDAIRIMQEQLDILLEERKLINKLRDTNKIIISIHTDDVNSYNFQRTLESLKRQLIKPEKIFVYKSNDKSKMFECLNDMKDDYFFFSCTDDIYYPQTYITDTIKKIKLNKQAVCYGGYLGDTFIDSYSQSNYNINIDKAFIGTFAFHNLLYKFDKSHLKGDYIETNVKTLPYDYNYLTQLQKVVV